MHALNTPKGMLVALVMTSALIFDCPNQLYALRTHGKQASCPAIRTGPKCADIKPLPSCVEGAFDGWLSVTRSSTSYGSNRENSFQQDTTPTNTEPMTAILEVPQFSSSEYFDRLDWKKIAKPPRQLMILPKVISRDA